MAKETAPAGDKQPEAAGPAPAKSNLMLVVIIAVLATLLIGGGITAFLVLRGGSHEPAEQGAADHEAPAEDDKKEDSKKKEDPKKKGGKDKESTKGPAIYVTLEPPFVVNFEASQAARFLQISVELMTRDAATATILKDNNPVVRNDLLLLFGNQDYAAIGGRDGKEALRKQALDVIRGLVKGEGGKPELVEAVYFTSFVMQ